MHKCKLDNPKVATLFASGYAESGNTYCQNLMSSPTSFHLFTILLDVLTSIFMFWDSGIGSKIFTCGPSLHAKGWTASHWNTQGSTKISIICITKNFIIFLTYMISDLILQHLVPQPLAMNIYGLEWSSRPYSKTGIWTSVAKYLL